MLGEVMTIDDTRIWWLHVVYSFVRLDADFDTILLD